MGPHVAKIVGVDTLIHANADRRRRHGQAIVVHRGIGKGRIVSQAVPATAYCTRSIGTVVEEEVVVLAHCRAAALANPDIIATDNRVGNIGFRRIVDGDRRAREWRCVADGCEDNLHRAVCFDRDCRTRATCRVACKQTVDDQTRPYAYWPATRNAAASRGSGVGDENSVGEGKGIL